MTKNKNTLAAAQTALDVYRALPGFDVAGEETALTDLITDLMHLADYKEVSGEYIADKARDYYLEELNDDLPPQYAGRHAKARELP